MTTKPDLLSFVEAAYRVGEPTSSWMDGVLSTFGQLLGGEVRGAATLFDATRPDWIELSEPINRDLPQPLLAELFNRPTQSEANQRAAVALYRRGYFGVASELSATFPEHRELFGRFGIADLTGLIAVDPTHSGCLLAIASPSRAYSPRARYLWRKLAAHLTAALRLRRALAELVARRGDPAEQAEAVLTPEGKVEHAVGAAVLADGQEALRDGLARIETARGERRYDGARAVDLWTGLVTGRWSLVEHFERGGRRYFLAYRNDPKLAGLRALTEREMQVWSYAAMGWSNKLIAYSLGLSPPTVAGHLRQSRRKLGGDVGPQVLAGLAADGQQEAPQTVLSKPTK